MTQIILLLDKVFKEEYIEFKLLNLKSRNF